MNPADKKPAPFHFVHTTVLLLAAFLILFYMKGGILSKLEYLLNSSSAMTAPVIKETFRLISFSEGKLRLAKFAMATAIFLIVGYAASFSALRLLRVSPAGGKRPRTALLALGWTLYFLALSLLALKAWADGRFPIEDAEIVVFTLANVRGGD